MDSTYNHVHVEANRLRRACLETAGVSGSWHGATLCTSRFEISMRCLTNAAMQSAGRVRVVFEKPC